MLLRDASRSYFLVIWWILKMIKLTEIVEVDNETWQGAKFGVCWGIPCKEWAVGAWWTEFAAVLLLCCCCAAAAASAVLLLLLLLCCCLAAAVLLLSCCCAAAVVTYGYLFSVFLKKYAVLRDASRSFLFSIRDYLYFLVIWWISKMMLVIWRPRTLFRRFAHRKHRVKVMPEWIWPFSSSKEVLVEWFFSQTLYIVTQKRLFSATYR